MLRPLHAKISKLVGLRVVFNHIGFGRCRAHVDFPVLCLLHTKWQNSILDVGEIDEFEGAVPRVKTPDTGLRIVAHVEPAIPSHDSLAVEAVAQSAGGIAFHHLHLPGIEIDDVDLYRESISPDGIVGSNEPPPLLSRFGHQKIAHTAHGAHRHSKVFDVQRPDLRFACCSSRCCEKQTQDKPDSIYS